MPGCLREIQVFKFMEKKKYIILLLMISGVLSVCADKSFSFFDVIKNMGVKKCLYGREASAKMSGTLDLSFKKSNQYPAMIFGKKFLERQSDWSGYKGLEIVIKNNGSKTAAMSVRIDDSPKPNPAQRKHCRFVKLTVPADGKFHSIYCAFEPTTLNFHVMRGQPRLPLEEYGRCFQGDSKFNLSKIYKVDLFMARPREGGDFSIKQILLTSKNFPKKPFVDKYGQFKCEDWPGKIHRDSDFSAQLSEEQQDNAKYLEKDYGFDSFGGWAKAPKKFDATGSFRVEKVNGKWWFIDPNGNLFWSVGICRAKTLSLVRVSGNYEWFFDKLPEQNSEFGKFYFRGPDRYNFFEANLYRKLGPDYKGKISDYITNRFKSWGVNTKGAWTDSFALTDGELLPFTVTVKLNFTEPHKRIHDVYSEKFQNELVKQMEYWRKYIDDNSRLKPYILGLFIDNELSWDRVIKSSNYRYVQHFFKKRSDSKTRDKCIQLLQDRYKSIKKLNNSWNTNYKSWNDLKGITFSPQQLSAAKSDLSAMTTMIAEKYFSDCRKMAKKYFPDKLYMGCRFNPWNREAVEVACKYCDVLSFNIYMAKPTDKTFSYPSQIKIAEKYDKPILVGEFHFGALDRGMFHGGLRKVKNQEARGKSYYQYVDAGLKNPYIIGVHWYQYQDQPLTSRHQDWENYNLGFVSITDTPYKELIKWARKINFNIYNIRYSEKK